MLKTQHRIERLEKVLAPVKAEPIVHCICFVDSDGNVDGTLELTHDARSFAKPRRPS